jgi:hypothetical protein
MMSGKQKAATTTSGRNTCLIVPKSPSAIAHDNHTQKPKVHLRMETEKARRHFVASLILLPLGKPVFHLAATRRHKT